LDDRNDRNWDSLLSTANILSCKTNGTGQREAHARRIHKFFVCDEFPSEKKGTCKSPETLGGPGVHIILLVNDADGVVERAAAADARVSMAAQDMFWGGRYGKSSILSATSGESTNSSESRVTKRLSAPLTNSPRNENKQNVAVDCD
jgi:hypothetical protein